MKNLIIALGLIFLISGCGNFQPFEAEKNDERIDIRINFKNPTLNKQKGMNEISYKTAPSNVNRVFVVLSSATTFIIQNDYNMLCDAISCGVNISSVPRSVYMVDILWVEDNFSGSNIASFVIGDVYANKTSMRLLDLINVSDPYSKVFDLEPVLTTSSTEVPFIKKTVNFKFCKETSAYSVVIAAVGTTENCSDFFGAGSNAISGENFYLSTEKQIRYKSISTSPATLDIVVNCASATYNAELYACYGTNTIKINHDTICSLGAGQYLYVNLNPLPSPSVESVPSCSSMSGFMRFL